MNLQTITGKYSIKAIVLLFYICVHPYSYSQCVIKDTLHVIYKYNNTSVQYVVYSIDNCSKDTLYLWIDKETIYNDSLTFSQNNIVFFYKYIRTPKCELGLSFLCNDGNINYGGYFPPPPVIGCTFLKRIVPGETFLVISMSDIIDKGSIH